MGMQARDSDRRTLERRGSRLRYRLEGPAVGPLVALTHGVMLDGRTFDPQTPALVAAGYRVLTWDIRGHGLSQPQGGELTIEVVADDLLAVLDDLGVQQAVLVGQSFGGMAVQRLLADHPQRVSAAVMIGTPALGHRPGTVMRLLQRLRIPFARVWPYQSIRRMFVTMVTTQPAVRRYVDEASAIPSKETFLAVSRAAMDGYLGDAEAPTHGVPVLLAQGVGEERGVARALRAWAESEPSARHVVIPDAGHLVNMDNPAGFNQVLTAFLGQQVLTP